MKTWKILRSISFLFLDSELLNQDSNRSVGYINSRAYRLFPFSIGSIGCFFLSLSLHRKKALHYRSNNMKSVSEGFNDFVPFFTAFGQSICFCIVHHIYESVVICIGPPFTSALLFSSIWPCPLSFFSFENLTMDGGKCVERGPSLLSVMIIKPNCTLLFMLNEFVVLRGMDCSAGSQSFLARDPDIRSNASPSIAVPFNDPCGRSIFLYVQKQRTTEE